MLTGSFVLRHKLCCALLFGFCLVALTVALRRPLIVQGQGSKALIGEEVVIFRTNFAISANDNQVFLVDEQNGKNFRATVKSVAANQLRVIVPFGAGTGRVLVETPLSKTLSDRARFTEAIHDPMRNDWARLSVLIWLRSSTTNRVTRLHLPRPS